MLQEPGNAFCSDCLCSAFVSVLEEIDSRTERDLVPDLRLGDGPLLPLHKYLLPAGAAAVVVGAVVSEQKDVSLRAPRASDLTLELR